MRADRLLSALLLLQAHGGLTARQLARRLEVSMRTVQRDMAEVLAPAELRAAVAADLAAAVERTRAAGG